MPIATRSQTLRLTLPSSSIEPSSSNSMISPHTPLPSEHFGYPALHFRYPLRSNLRRRRSSESFASLASEESGLSGMSSLMLENTEWEDEHLTLLNKALDSLPEHLTTPYVGNIPPPNLLQNLAKGILRDKPVGWSHTLATTRRKLRELAEERANEVNVTHPPPGHVVETRPGRRYLTRSDSMDFLPGAGAVDGMDRVAAASRRMQRLDQILEPTFRPTTRRSRSPSSRHEHAAEATPPSATTTHVNMPRPLIRTRTDIGPYVPPPPPSAAVQMPPPLRRTESAMAFIALPGNESPNQRTLKRAPSYGSVNTEAAAESSNPPKRRRLARRPRPPSFLGGPLPGLEMTPAQEGIPFASSAVNSSSDPVTPCTPSRRSGGSQSHLSNPGPPTVSPKTPSERVRTRSQTKADADAAALQEQLEREASKSAEQDKENTPSTTRRARGKPRPKKDHLPPPLESPFDEVKKTSA